MRAPAFIGLALVFVIAATAWVVVATAWVVAAPAWAGPARDRLERFREIAVARLSVVEDTGGALDPASQAEMDALLDGEVLDSLQAGGPFASVEFIRERLDAFAEAWGGASLRIDPLGGGLLVGRFRLSAKGVSNSVRLYGSAKGKPALLRAWQEDGVPEVYPWAVPAGGGAQILVSWSGTATGWGSWPLRLDLWRVRDGLVSAVWRSAERYPEGLWVSQVDVKPGRVHLRHEFRYPGWKPGCDVQAEQEDRYRADPGGGLTLVSRQVFNGWHRELQRSATRFFSALASGDRKALAELAPDAALRRRLPVGLLAEAACDAQNPDTPGTAVVAAAAPLPDGRRAPWSLWWSRGPSGWRLTGAAPVLQ
jgi:hypothetical protein